MCVPNGQSFRFSDLDLLKLWKALFYSSFARKANNVTRLFMCKRVASNLCASILSERRHVES